MKVGIFDSGLGGLTVLKEIVHKYPNNKYYYFGDNLNAPYGEKSINQLLQLSNNIINFLIKKEVDIIIVACGTVSSNVFDKIKTNIPMYNVIEPTIEYLNNSSYPSIGLIATPMTIKSKVFNKKINKNLITKSCPKFVPLIENYESVDEYLPVYLNDFKDKIDVLVLGCTHYPIIKKEIEEYFDNKVGIINMGKILAEKLNLDSKGESKIRLYFSKVNHTLISNIDRIIDFDYSLEEVVLEDINA